MSTLKVIEQKVINFNGAEIMGVKTDDGKVRAAVKWICEGIGLTDGQTKGERKRIQEDLVLSQGGRNLTLPTKGGTQEVLTIELDFLPLWLAKISITPNMQVENPEVVSNLVQYQLKAKEVLADAFFNKPKTQAEVIAMIAQHNVEQEKRLNRVEQRLVETEKKQEYMKEVLSLNPVEWRKKVNNILNKIAMARGGYDAFQDVRNESYQYLEDRGKCNLSVRLTNRKGKMALEGTVKSKIDKTSKLDVIADDARLTEIYLAIVKEMAIKSGVEMGSFNAISQG